MACRALLDTALDFLPNWNFHSFFFTEHPLGFTNKYSLTVLSSKAPKLQVLIILRFLLDKKKPFQNEKKTSNFIEAFDSLI